MNNISQIIGYQNNNIKINKIYGNCQNITHKKRTNSLSMCKNCENFVCCHEINRKHNECVICASNYVLLNSGIKCKHCKFSPIVLEYRCEICDKMSKVCTIGCPNNESNVFVSINRCLKCFNKN